MKSYNHYIGGQWVDPAGGEWFDTENPYTGEVWARIARGTESDVSRAVSAAKMAFEGEWGSMNPTKRGKLLVRLAELIEREAPRLGEIEVRDNGKLIAEMGAQTRYMAEWYRYYGGLADKIEGAVIPTDKPGIFNFTRYEPLGVVAMITPWNSPLLLLTWKLAAALAAGNTAVVKPSEFTSASTLEFAELFEEAGFPPGVFNVVTGFGAEAGAPLVVHPHVEKVAFTGSDVAGQKIYEAAAKKIMPVTLELGGKSPNIVFADADMEAAVMGAISGIFAATGQTCIAGSRLLLQRSIHDDFVKRLVEVAGEARMGDPMSPETHVGPITTRSQFQKVLDYIGIAKAEGATCVLGGGPYSGPSTKGSQFVAPTIFTNVRNDMRIAQEEVFGPVLSVIPFEDEVEAIAIANDIDFGLAAGVWTSDIGRALRMSERLRAGTVWVNTYRAVSFTSPFGGYKRSGEGRESGKEAIKEFLQVKSVWIAQEASTQNPFIIR
ncbi:aldehyde dehydrogenase (plasmid) [Aminobacter sp. SR38]|jgi:aldehyde dehydrogenase (NAD+)|uniref:aldehyde dehydrogenase n=1 Tax=Aminobacter sp. SR38 TaxID=2774562 RepID=UPI0017842261|nr:aldehyde dehydrogenase [Aminobacter sp. SR38]QOF75078.1 aldehyde dehydrogenase [Aminobacter sp. SR38]